MLREYRVMGAIKKGELAVIKGDCIYRYDPYGFNEEIRLSIKEKDVLKIRDSLLEITRCRVPYNHDYIEMANEAIKKMRTQAQETYDLVQSIVCNKGE